MRPRGRRAPQGRARGGDVAGMRLPGVLRRLRDTDCASESGWALIETMFSAALLVVIALAVMSSMDVASRTSAATKGRTVASSLAEQDQERMRAMTINQLSNYHATADPTVGGVTYHVDSRSEWVQDTSGQVASCSDTGQASYVRISSTVTSDAVGRDTKPVVMRGIVAPPVGSLGRQPGHARRQGHQPQRRPGRQPARLAHRATSRCPTTPTPWAARSSPTSRPAPARRTRSRSTPPAGSTRTTTRSARSSRT